MSHAPRELRVNVDGGSLFVTTTGAGPPLLMVHGWPLDHRMFGPQFEELAGTFQVIGFDRRGFGRSEAPPDLRRELDDIDRILEALDLESTHLLGMSQGGRIAIRYAVTRPSRLRSLLLQGAVVDGLRVEEHEAERVPVAEYAELVDAGRIEDVRRHWLHHPMMALDPQFSEQAQLVRRLLDEYTGADLIGFDPASYRFDNDVPAALETLSVPTLILTGGHETAARKRHADELRRRIPGARELMLEGSGHLSNLTSAAQFNHAVSEFCLTAERARRDQDEALLME